MAGVASYIIKKKISTLWEWPNIGKLILNCFMAISSGLSIGFMAGFGTDYLIGEELFSVQEFTFFYSLVLAVPTCMVDIFPFLKPPPIIFKIYYPVSLSEKLKVSLATNFIRSYFLFLFFSQVLLITISNYIDLREIAVSSLFLLTTYLLNRMFRTAIYFRVPYPKLLFSIYLSIFSLSVLILWKLDTGVILRLLGLFIILKLILLIYIENKKREREKKFISKIRYRKGIILKILANKNLKTLIWLAFIFKILILTCAGVFFKQTGNSLFGVEAFSWVFASPVILFTYFGYNFFGINKNLFFTLSIRVHSFTILAKVYAKIMLPILVIDAFIFVWYLSLTNQYSLKFILFYATSFILLFFTAFPISLYFPVIKEKYYSLDFTRYGAKTVSFTVTATAIGVMSLALLATQSEYFWAIDAVLVIIAVCFAAIYPRSLPQITRNFHAKTRL